MGWRASEIKDEKIKFVGDYLKGEFNFSELCQRYSISRPTGYALIERYHEEGLEAFEEKSRAPHHIPHKTSTKLASILIELKHRYPTWGPRKIRDYLEAEGKKEISIAASTIGEIYKQHGLVKSRRYRKRVPAHSEPLRHCMASNEVWSADFKGQFRLKDKRYCYPLTITDNYSRYLFLCQGLISPNCNDTLKYFEKVFIEYGLPKAIRTDNGQPFCGMGLGGLTRLSIWFLKLGIMPERIALGHPEQNGRHERMHKTLKASTIVPRTKTLKQQQNLFDEFIQEYNHQRPHEALEGKRPAEIYKTAIREYPNRLPEIYYPDNYMIRKVKHNGDIKFAGKRYFVSELLHGEPIGLEVIDEDRAFVYLAALKLGIIDARLNKIIRP
jgi:putative transposase